MANRRIIAAGFASLQQLFNDLVKQRIDQENTVANSKLISERQREASAEEDARAAAGQLATDRRMRAEMLLNHPEIATRLSQNGVNDPYATPSLTQMGQSPQEALGGVMKNIDAATSPEMLPGEGGISAQLAAAGMPLNPISLPGSKFIPAMTAKVPQGLSAAMMERNARKEAFDTAQTEKYMAENPRYDPATQGMVRTIPGQGDVQTAPNVPEAIVNTNQTERGTSASKAASAAATAGASAGASARAVLAPDIVKGKAEEAGAITAAQEAAKAEGGKMTSQEGQDASYYANMMAAAIDANRAASRGGRLKPGLEGIITNPILASTIGQSKYYTDDDKLYAQAALNYSTMYTYLTSGKQTNLNEFPRNLNVHFANSADNPMSFKQKQDAVASNIIAAQSLLTSKASKKEAGRLLGWEVTQGNISGEELAKMPITDEDIKAGILSVIGPPKAPGGGQ